MASSKQLVYVLGGVTLLWLVLNGKKVADAAQSGVDDVTAAIAGWKSVQQGPVWVPVINQTEQSYGIPADLLARMAYQESHFRPDIISGATASSAGNLGILQLSPTYFDTVNVPRPYSSSDVVNQISEAGQELVRLYGQFGDWGKAVAAYNAGSGVLSQYLSDGRTLKPETINYVNQILADVPVSTTLQV